jgi:hypothetical protein
VIPKEKIRWAINGFGFYETAGENGIFPGLLQQGNETMPVPLCKIFTACLAFGSQSLAKRENYIHTKASA